MKVTATNQFIDSIKRLDSLGSKFRELRCWVKYHFNKDFFRVLKTTLKAYPWDCSYLYEIERVKLIEMMKYHIKCQRFVGWEEVVRDIKICISLLDIITERKHLFHFNGNVLFVKSGEDYELQETPDFKYICDVKVNTRNIDRFVDEKHKEWALRMPHELYKAKAKALYHKIRYERDEGWWD